MNTPGRPARFTEYDFAVLLALWSHGWQSDPTNETIEKFANLYRSRQ
jgi:hypothetical protein